MDNFINKPPQSRFIKNNKKGNDHHKASMSCNLESEPKKIHWRNSFKVSNRKNTPRSLRLRKKSKKLTFYSKDKSKGSKKDVLEVLLLIKIYFLMY